MKLEAFGHLWGLDHVPREVAMLRIAEQGYRGVEVVLQREPGLARLHAAAADAGLAIKPLLQLSGGTPGEQLAEYRHLLELAARFDPAGITVHGGRDRWPLDVAIDFYRDVVALEAELGVPVGHETHRGRPLHAPWSTAAILEAVPELRLTCDFSHWVVVGERLLEDQAEAIALAASRAVHVHARVGYAQGPQVPDPRAPEWADEVAAHERWWQLVWGAQARAGIVASTFTPEYGPPPYLHTLPYGDVPVADLQAIWAWQKQRVGDLFEQWAGRAVRSFDGEATASHR